MRRRHWLFLLMAGLVLCLTATGSAQKTPRLFFSKEIRSAQKDEAYTHQVREGEWLYEILRSYGFSDEEIPQLIKAIARLNPHIRDLDTIQPGQTIYIPPVRPVTVPETHTAPPLKDPLRYIPRTYVIQPGDTTVTILRQYAKVPEHLIFNEYLRLFKQANPALRNLDQIEVGQRVKVPVPAGNADFVADMGEGVHPPQANRTMADGADSPAPPSPDPEPILETPADAEEEPETSTNATRNRPLTTAMLERMGVTFVSGTESLLPVPDGGWYRVNVQQTPLGTTSWGEQLLLVPERNRLNDFPDSLKGEVTLCELPDDWDPAGVFARLEAATDKKISPWPENRPLILRHKGYTVELKGDYAVVVEALPRNLVYLFNILKDKDGPVPSLLRGFLARLSIQVGEWRSSGDGTPESVVLRWPAMSSLLTPTLASHNAWSELKPLLGEAGEAISPPSRNIVTVMSELQNAGLAVPKVVRFPFRQDRSRSIIVSLPAMVLTTPTGPVYVFDSRHADPYLLALLTLKGEHCYGVSD